MIQNLIVENIALIDRLQIEFAEGLNVLTGETGAGKSIIVDSMNLVLGERADREMIRHGKDRARVEAVLYPDTAGLRELFAKHGIPMEEELIVTRELSAAGKNMCRLNGVAVNLSTLKELMDRIVDLHGQHEHQSLLYPANHISLIDNLGSEGLAALKRKIADEYAQLRLDEKNLAQLGGDPAERKRMADLLEYQINELTGAQLTSGELESLKQEREVLANAQAIAVALKNGYDVLYLGDEEGRSALSAIKGVTDSLARFAGLGETFSELTERLKESYYTLEETARDLGAQAESVVFDEQRQNEVEERIDFLNSLKRKYDVADEDGLIAYFHQAQQKLEELANSGARSAQLTETIESRKDRLYQLYQELSAKRQQTAEGLKQKLLKELGELGMPHARFEARFLPLPGRDATHFSANGADQVEFYISTNAGEPLKPLSKTASGGEISRIMLAFKTISAKSDHISTVIFDEIDTGISGHMAHVVAQKMASISRSRQVICVTHLPQIAAMADRNFLIQKESGQASTNTSIRALDEVGIQNEIVRLAGGIDSQNAAAYAGELLENAAQLKKRITKQAGD